MNRTEAAAADLRAALAPAERLNDPAVRLRLLTALLAIDGDDGILAQARDVAQSIFEQLPTSEMRRTFQNAPPLQDFKLLGSTAIEDRDPA